MKSSCSLPFSCWMHAVTQIIVRDTSRKGYGLYITSALSAIACRMQLLAIPCWAPLLTPAALVLEAGFGETQLFQLSQEAEFRQCKQLAAELLAAPHNKLLLVLKAFPALDLQVACICSSPDGTQSS